jgi:prevent-host-death family protein
MIKIGLREANLHFSKYVKMVKDGKEVVLTERGMPIAVIKPIPHEGETESRVKVLEEQGILKRARKGAFPVHKPITIRGKPISEIVAEEREERF